MAAGCLRGGLPRRKTRRWPPQDGQPTKAMANGTLAHLERAQAAEGQTARLSLEHAPLGKAGARLALGLSSRQADDALGLGLPNEKLLPQVQPKQKLISLKLHLEFGVA